MYGMSIKVSNGMRNDGTEFYVGLCIMSNENIHFSAKSW